jgi:hypothetical protein
MPKVEPVIIPTKGLSFWPTLWALLTSVRRWRLTEDWRYTLPIHTTNAVYRDNGKWTTLDFVENNVTIIIPKGFEFDGASIPKPLYFLAGVFLVLLIIGIEISAVLMLLLAALFMLSGLLLSPVGIMLIAGLVHDFAYAHGYLWREYEGGIVQYKYNGGGRLNWDDLFFRINLDVNGAIYADWIAAALLKMFGGIAWQESRKAKYPEILPGR